jgi:hypothetical protein
LRLTKRETSFHGMPIQAGPDLGAFLNATRRPAAFAHVVRRLMRHGWDMLRHGRATHLLNGVALTGRLFAMARRYGVTIRPATAVTGLEMTDGRVSAAILGDGERLAVRRGVVLATGGVSASAAWRARLFPHAGPHATLAVDEADGAGAALAEALGADFADDLAANGAWCPVSHVVWPDGERGVFPTSSSAASPA